MALKAVKTRYNGYIFRSRLEARWALFFDEMGWEYDYEQEGYLVGSGCYLPDFKFEQWGVFAEVKPGKLTDEEIQKCRDISKESDSPSGAIDFLLLEGPPKNKAYRTIIDGELGTPVLFLSKDQKHHPFFSSDEFISQWTMLYDTEVAVRISKEKEFKGKEYQV